MLTPNNSDNLPRFAISTNSGAGEMPTMGTNALPAGQQTHIAISYNFTAGASALYINGQRVRTGPASIPLQAINDINVWLGRSNWPDPYFNGQLDEFRLYNGVLWDASVAASFAGGRDALLGGRPTLRVTRSGNNLQLAWPSDATNYVLEAAAGLASPSVWSTVTNTPISQNGQQIVTLSITNATRFFRLRK